MPEIRECIVNFDYSLKIKTLKQKQQFIGANFHFMMCGCGFKAEHADQLYSEWKKHSMELAKKELGIKLAYV